MPMSEPKERDDRHRAVEGVRGRLDEPDARTDGVGMRPTNSDVRLGVIGCGVTGRRHLQAADTVEGVRVVAVADTVPDAAHGAVMDFRVPAVYTDPLALLDDETVDAVVLALPTSARQQLALRSFEAGKHVLLEKPAAAGVADLRALIDGSNGLVVACASARFRTTGAARAATAVIASGQLGTIREIRIHGHQGAPARPEVLPPAWRLQSDINGGGILWNWGPYDLDFALGICGWTLRPQAVFGQSWPIAPELTSWVPAGSDGETHGVGLIRFTDGAVLTIDRGEYLPTRSTDTVEILGTHGSITGNPHPGPTAGLVLTEIDPASGVTLTKTMTLQEDYDAIGQGLIADFAGAIHTGGRPLTSVNNYLDIARITESIRDSARTGRAVHLATGEL